LDERKASRPAETPEAREIALAEGVAVAPATRVHGLPDSVDFASHRAARGKMQLWLTTFTVVAALAVLVVVSVTVFYAN